ncbi:MAG: phosphoglycerate mutase [Ramlibacter sp.]|nr:phosphoglycerate mutase [Ramlibacter sp.]
MNSVIPFASAMAEGCGQAAASLDLPHLERLLTRLSPSPIDGGDENALSMPHERLLARSRGLEPADGLIPLAALDACDSGRPVGNEACAWVTPCHWHVAMDHITMNLSSRLQATEQDMQAVFEAVRPYFEQDGINLEIQSPLRWLARGEIFRDLPTASLDRVDGADIDRWIPRARAASALRRLQQETQMLLYTHPVNDKRQAAGLLPINSFWISATGALPPSTTPLPDARLSVIASLRDAALAHDWVAWTAAWREVDSTQLAALCTSLDKGHPISLTLCGERNSQTWSSSPHRGDLRTQLRKHLSLVGARLGLLAGRRVPAVLQAL